MIKKKISKESFNQLEGMGSFYSNSHKSSILEKEKGLFLFSFAPDNPVPDRVERFRRRGTGQMNSDGSFEFITFPKKKSESTLIKKYPHGRLSLTKDGAVQLTLKFYVNDEGKISSAMKEETKDACGVIKELERRAR